MTLDSNDIYDWLHDHPNCDLKINMVLKELAVMLMTAKMNDNKIHIKVESLVKSAEKTFTDYED